MSAGESESVGAVWPLIGAMRDFRWARHAATLLPEQLFEIGKQQILENLFLSQISILTWFIAQKHYFHNNVLMLFYFFFLEVIICL